MKVIELLTKIANGEEVPKEIKYDTMNYVFRHYDYKEVHGELIDEQSSWLEKIDFYKLNDEVEIIEEPKKIEKLKQRTDTGLFGSMVNDEISVAEAINKQANYISDIVDKINEIIDYIMEDK